MNDNLCLSLQSYSICRTEVCQCPCVCPEHPYAPCLFCVSRGRRQMTHSMVVLQPVRKAFPLGSDRMTTPQQAMPREKTTVLYSLCCTSIYQVLSYISTYLTLTILLEDTITIISILQKSEAQERKVERKKNCYFPKARKLLKGN